MNQKNKYRIVVSVAWAIAGYIYLAIKSRGYDPADFSFVYLTGLWAAWNIPVFMYWTCIWLWGKVPLPKLPEFGPMEETAPEQSQQAQAPGKKQVFFHGIVLLAFYYAGTISGFIHQFGVVGLTATFAVAILLSNIIMQRAQRSKYGAVIRGVTITVSIIVLLGCIVATAVQEDNARKARQFSELTPEQRRKKFEVTIDEMIQQGAFENDQPGYIK